MTTFHRAVLGALAMVAAAALPASADDDWAQKAINNPADSWGIWGTAKTEVVNDPAVQGGKAKRVTISPLPEKPWDIGAYILITKPVKKGDVLLLAFWARAESSPAGGDFVELSGRVYEAAPPSTSVTPQTDFLIGKQWKLYYASGTADKDYPVGALSCGMLLGTGEQTIDFGPAFIVDYGQGYDVAKLPRN